MHRDRLAHRFRRSYLAAGPVLVLLLIALFTAQPAARAQEDQAKGNQGPWSLSRPCENFSHPYEADLCQQWRMAQAAERTARQTRLIVILTSAVAVLLLLLFLALLGIAFAARRAGRALNLLGRHEEAELRAYVDVDKLEFVGTPEADGVVKVKVVVKNSGQTPAFQARTAAEVDIREGESEDQVPVMPLPAKAANSGGTPRLGRDATSASIVQCQATTNIADRIVSGEAMIVVWGWTEYLDVFGAKRKTQFQYLCNSETLESGLIFKPMGHGNEAA